MMDVRSIIAYITDTFADVHAAAVWGETAFFYNPRRVLPRGVYFATIKDRDGDNDRASKLQRPDVYRLNIGITPASYHRLFGAQPARPRAGGIVNTGHDFSALNELLPHPVYGWMSWVSVLNPTTSTFETVKPLLAEAYALAVGKFAKRTGRR